MVALAEVAFVGPATAGFLVGVLCERFGCSERAVEDGLSVLRRGGYVECESLEQLLVSLGSSVVRVSDRLRDGRRRFYRISERGQRVLDHPNGPRVLWRARELLTTCPSPKTRRMQKRVAELEGVQAALRRYEKMELAVDPAQALAEHAVIREFRRLVADQRRHKKTEMLGAAAPS
jgi:hypothetical protein